MRRRGHFHSGRRDPAGAALRLSQALIARTCAPSSKNCQSVRCWPETKGYAFRSPARRTKSPCASKATRFAAPRRRAEHAYPQARSRTLRRRRFQRSVLHEAGGRRRAAGGGGRDPDRRRHGLSAGRALRPDAPAGAGGDAVLERLHQEDFCQAQGIVSEMKYQKEGGPVAQAMFRPAARGLKRARHRPGAFPGRGDLQLPRRQQRRPRQEFLAALSRRRNRRTGNQAGAALRHRQHGLLPGTEPRHGNEDRRRIFLGESHCQRISSNWRKRRASVNHSSDSASPNWPIQSWPPSEKLKLPILSPKPSQR